MNKEGQTDRQTNRKTGENKHWRERMDSDTMWHESKNGGAPVTHNKCVCSGEHIALSMATNQNG